ncbi:MAG: NADH-quinone oxidoreductase subunit K [Bryobacteraceae bacterium]|jgi:hydrogenase-4 component E
MYFYQDPQFGNRMITLMAAFVLVLQIAMVGQRWLITNIRVFAAQSFLLAGIANTIAYFNHAPHLYAAAFLTFALKAVLLPIVLERLYRKIDIDREITPLINVPVSVVIAGGLTTVGYLVAQSLHRPEETASPASLGHNTLAVAVSLFLIGFYMMITRRKALMQVLALLCLENGLFLAAISLTYGVPMIVELGILFDLVVAVMVLGILVYRIQETLDSMDVSKLSRLRG